MLLTAVPVVAMVTGSAERLGGSAAPCVCRGKVVSAVPRMRLAKVGTGESR